LVEIMTAHDSEHLDQLNDLVREISCSRATKLAV
jgi:hypothetical protein